MPVSTAQGSYWVYILASKPNGTLYLGVTNSLERGIWEHKSGLVAGFTKKYGVKSLVYFEEHRRPGNAIRREKELKGWLRRKKTDLIRERKLLWRDLADDWYRIPLDTSLCSE